MGGPWEERTVRELRLPVAPPSVVSANRLYGFERFVVQSGRAVRCTGRPCHTDPETLGGGRTVLGAPVAGDDLSP